jgi:hypothetical protein
VSQDTWQPCKLLGLHVFYSRCVMQEYTIKCKNMRRWLATQYTLLQGHAQKPTPSSVRKTGIPIFFFFFFFFFFSAPKEPSILEKERLRPPPAAHTQVDTHVTRREESRHCIWGWLKRCLRRHPVRPLLLHGYQSCQEQD